MPLSLRVAGVAVALLATTSSPAVADAIAPPTLAGTQLSTPPAGEPGGAIVRAARCFSRFGAASFSATGVAVNGAYEGPYAEHAAALLGAGGLSEDFEPRPLIAAGHSFTIRTPEGSVLGTQTASDVPDAATCVKPYFDTANLYLSYATTTRYAARIETADGVYVDRGEGFVSVDIVEGLTGARTANTQTSFESPDAEVTTPLRRRDCRRGGFAELAYSSHGECLEAAERDRVG